MAKNTVFDKCFYYGKGDDKHKYYLKMPHMQIYIPEEYFEKGIAIENGMYINIFGFFTISIWDTYDVVDTEPKYQFQYLFPSVIETSPSEMTEIRGDNGEGVLEVIRVLNYTQGDLFIKSTLIEQSSSVVNKFMELLFQGFIPDIIPYNRLVDLWKECVNLNGMNLKVNQFILEIIIAELCRNPNKIPEEFRMLLNRNPKIDQRTRKIVKLVDLPALNSTFAAVVSAYSKKGITSSINREREGGINKDSPLEDAIL